MLVETAVRMKFFQTTATHEPQKLMSGHIMEEHIINITSSKIERERERERRKTILYQSQGHLARCYICSEVQCFENPFCGEVQCAKKKKKEQRNWKIRDQKKHRFWTTQETLKKVKEQCSFSPNTLLLCLCCPVNPTTSWTCPEDLN